MIFSGACAVLIVIVMCLPLCGLMSVIAGVILGDVMMDTPVKFCLILPFSSLSASALCHTVYPMMFIWSGSLMCVSVRARMSILLSFMIWTTEWIFPASSMPVMFQKPVYFLLAWDLCVVSVSAGCLWVQHVLFEPVCSGVLLAVHVVCLLPLLSVAFGCGDVHLYCVAVFVVLKPAVVWCVTVLLCFECDLEVASHKVVYAPVCKSLLFVCFIALLG